MRFPRPASAVAVLFLVGCGATSVDGRFTRNALDRAAEMELGAEISAVESPGGDGSVYQFAGRAGDKLCFTGTIDNRDDRAKADHFRVRLFGEDADQPLADLETTTEVLRERSVGQPGAVRTNQFVVGPDGAPVGEMVELTTVGYPVADVKLCFDGLVAPESRFVVLNRLPKSDERSAPSYAAWKR